MGRSDRADDPHPGDRAVLSSVLMLDLRLLGIVGRDQPLARVTHRFRPVIWWTLPILLVTGS